MAYLDVSPMMVAFRTSPEDFEIRDGWLHHIPSRHQFLFGPDDKVQLVAECNCASLSIKPDQSQALAGCYREWQATYWRPLEINKEFASHFHHSALRKMLIHFTAWLHRRLLENSHAEHHRGKIGALHPAE